MIISHKLHEFTQIDLRRIVSHRRHRINRNFYQRDDTRFYTMRNDQRFLVMQFVRTFSNEFGNFFLIPSKDVVFPLLLQVVISHHSVTPRQPVVQSCDKICVIHNQSHIENKYL